MPDAEVLVDDIVLTIKRAEALVLFELLSRFVKANSLTVEDQAEQRVLWDMCCDLERVLVEPFRADYEALLRQARDKVRDPKTS